MSDSNIGAAAAALLEAGAVQVSTGRPFMLAAGWASPVYVDCRRLIGEPAWRREITSLAATAIQHANIPTFDAIAGAETAGIPFAAWLADRLSLPMRYVRKRRSASAGTRKWKAAQSITCGSCWSTTCARTAAANRVRPRPANRRRNRHRRTGDLPPCRLSRRR